MGINKDTYTHLLLFIVKVDYKELGYNKIVA